MSDPINTPADNAVETRYLVMPGHANAFGTAFGGAIMSWIDDNHRPVDAPLRVKARKELRQQTTR